MFKYSKQFSIKLTIFKKLMKFINRKTNIYVQIGGKIRFQCSAPKKTFIPQKNKKNKKSSFSNAKWKINKMPN